MTEPNALPKGAVASAQHRRRYRSPRWHRRLSTAMAAIFLGLAVAGHDRWRYASAGVWLLAALVAWLAPLTVVDAAGFRTLARFRRRRVGWAEVATVPDASPGLGVVKVRLVDGTLVTLHSVGVGEVSYLRQMLERSRGAPVLAPRPDHPPPAP